jgi:hypothetical protein
MENAPEQYQILVKSPVSGKLEAIATLQRDPVLNPSKLPYIITGGSIFGPKTSMRSACASLIGMTATPVDSARGLLADQLDAGILTAADDAATMTAPSATGEPPSSNKPEQAAPPAAVTAPPGLQEAVPQAEPPFASADRVTRDAVTSPIVSLDLGPSFAQLRYVGLKIDSNDSLRSNVIGPAIDFSFHPAAFASRVSDTGPAARWLLPFKFSYAAAMLDSMKPVAIERNGETKGSQENSLRTQSVSVAYQFSYFRDQMRTTLNATPWSTEKIRSNLRYLANPPTDTMRDLEISCVALGITQAFRFTNGIELALAFDGCVQNEAKTPANTRAEFPNQRTQFSKTKQFEAHFKSQFPFRVPNRATLREEYPLYALVEFGFKRWQGSLELDDKQTIDADVTKLSATLGLGLSIN